MMAMRLVGDPLRRSIRSARPEAGVGPATIVMRDPFVKDLAKMLFTKQRTSTGSSIAI
jgi:hypothetical protein